MKSFRNTLPKILFAALITLLGASCSDDCSENQNALPLAGFYSSTGAEVSVDSLRVVGLGAPGDSVLYAGSGAITQLYLPFRVTSDTTTYLFGALPRMVLDTVTDEMISLPVPPPDTVTFIYSRTPVFVSEECGVSYRFDIRKIRCRGLMIDSVTCPMGYIDNVNAQNLRIYFSPALFPEEPDQPVNPEQ